MVAINRECYTCKFLKSDFACATDYCERGNDDVMFNETDCENQCKLFEPDHKKIERIKQQWTK